MTIDNQTPLPEPKYPAVRVGLSPLCQSGWTFEQITNYGDARAAHARKQALEEAAGAAQPVSIARTDAEIIALNKGDRYFSTSESRFGKDVNPHVQYHTGEPGYIAFVRHILFAVAQPVSAAVPMEWDQALRVSEYPLVDSAIRNLIDDPTEDNAVGMVQAIVNAAAPQPPEPASAKPLTDAIEAVHEAHFRTEYDTGANPTAMLIMNAFRRLAGLEHISLSDLPAYCSRCKKYHPQPMCEAAHNIKEQP